MAPFGASRAGLMSVAEDDIPDSDDLQAHYDFSEEDGSMPVSDLSGNGVDLDNGSYSGVGTEINGVQAGRFDRDIIYNHTDLNIPKPSTTFVVFEIVSSDAGDRYFDAGDPNDNSLFHSIDDEYTFGMDGNNSLASVAVEPTAGDIKLLAAYGDEDEQRLDIFPDDETGTGPGWTGNQSGITVGGRGDLDNESDIKVGEILVYDGYKTDIADDVRSYIENKWGTLN